MYATETDDISFFNNPQTWVRIPVFPVGIPKATYPGAACFEPGLSLEHYLPCEVLQKEEIDENHNLWGHRPHGQIGC